MYAGAPLVLLVQGIEANEVLLRMTGHLQQHAVTLSSDRQWALAMTNVL